MLLTSGLNSSPVLTELQKKVLVGFFAHSFLSKHFYLTGGTALSAFYLEHRFSEDLDFFTHDQPLEHLPKIFTDFCQTLHLACEHMTISPSYQRFLVDHQLKIDFVKDIPFRVGVPLSNPEGILVDSIENIASNKITAMLGRLEPKDYVDLYFILNETELKLETIFEWAKNKDGGLESFVWASLLGDAQNFQILPQMAACLRIHIYMVL